VQYSIIQTLFRDVIISHFLSFLPMAVLIVPPIQRLMTFTAPSWPIVALQLIASLVIYDIVFFAIHRLLHTPYLYGRVHKVASPSMHSSSAACTADISSV